MTSEGGRQKALVLGAKGMAGHVVSGYLEEAGHTVVRAARSPVRGHRTVCLDVTRDTDLSCLLADETFDVVVNCVGALVEQSRNRVDQAVWLNAWLPHRLERLTRNTDTRVIQLSTDCVFSGHSGPYVESALRDGDRVYDRSKALGELTNQKDLTLRMSIIGPEIRSQAGGLMHWFLGQTGEVPGYTRAIWNGVTTLELAKAINGFLDADVTGIYHLVPNYNISKFDLLGLIADSFGRSDLVVRPESDVEVDKTLIDTRRTSPYVVGRSGYKQMVHEICDWVATHSDLYGSFDRYATLGSRR